MKDFTRMYLGMFLNFEEGCFTYKNKLMIRKEKLFYKKNYSN